MKKKKNFRKSYKKKPTKPFYKKKIFWVTGTILICIFILTYFLFFFRFFWVDNIQISGSEMIPREDIENFIEDRIFFDISFLYSKTIFLIKKSEISVDIIQEFPEIRTVTIKRVFPDKLEVRIKEREALAIWCRENKNAECFLIDREGIIFRRFSPSGMAVIFGGNNNAQLGENALSREEMSLLVDIWKEVKNVGIIGFTVSDSDINIRTAEKWNILFTSRESVSSQALKLFLTIENRIPSEKRKDLDYIDVRFENRVYFKYK